MKPKPETPEPEKLPDWVMRSWMAAHDAWITEINSDALMQNANCAAARALFETYRKYAPSSPETTTSNAT